MRAPLHHRSGASLLLLVFAACAVEGSDSTVDDGEDACTADKCDDPGGSGAPGVMLVNPCQVSLAVGLAQSGDDSPLVQSTIESGGQRWFPADPGDRLVTTDVGHAGWRTVVWVESHGKLTLDPGWCPWDVFVESGTVTEKAADGRDWDPGAVGGYIRPDPYATGFGGGQAENCLGHLGVQGTPTSTADDTTTPAWDEETLSWIAWHDMSDAVELVVTDDDVGLGGEPIGTCRFENIPRPEQLPAVITSDCGGGGSMTIRIEPADADAIETLYIRILGSCS